MGSVSLTEFARFINGDCEKNIEVAEIVRIAICNGPTVALTSTFSQNRTVSTILIDQTKTFARNDGNDICRYKTAQSVKQVQSRNLSYDAPKNTE